MLRKPEGEGKRLLRLVRYTRVTNKEYKKSKRAALNVGQLLLCYSISNGIMADPPPEVQAMHESNSNQQIVLFI